MQLSFSLVKSECSPICSSMNCCSVCRVELRTAISMVNSSVRTVGLTATLSNAKLDGDSGIYISTDLELESLIY
jgi:hypothetical protein